MANQWSNSGKSTPDYDAFINFRGADIREDLIDILRHFMVQSGIRFFYDDDSLRKGDVIDDEIYRGIERSQVYIVMLSKNYANSKWCLREVAHMVECQEKERRHGRKVILPVFCGVRVEDVKLKEGSSYKTDLEKLSAKLKKPEELKALQDWKQALQKVAEIKGLHRGNTGAVDFSQIIVREVQSRLNVRPLSYHMVGIDKEAKEVEAKLDVESGDVRFLVIYGEEGMGKTTLARAVFQGLSSRFQGSSFIVDVPEMEKRYSYLYLQHKLLRDICGECVEEGKPKDIKKSFRDKKVLIVLDGVNKWEQIEKLAGSSTWFGPGSRIMITCSYLEVLSPPPDMHDSNSSPPREFLTFRKWKLEFDQALKLFSRYAFWQDSAWEEYEKISHQIVQYSDRLPLTLEIMGSLLHGSRNIDEWEEIAEKLKNAGSLRAKLKISYDKLPARLLPSAQKIFLDIACFFVNEEKTNPVYMWNRPKDADGMKVLLTMCLVKIVDGNKLWMHDCLRDLGRDAVRTHLLHEQRSRFWDRDEALKALKYPKEHKVEAICSCYYERRKLSLQLTSQEFSRKVNLRFLKFHSMTFQGDFKDHLRELRWLSWHDGPQDFGATNFASKALVVLDLAQSGITDKWDGWKQLEEENDLKVIDLTRCHDLINTPIFSPFTGLERVILEDCKKLTEIDSSIGELKNLRCLNVRGCDSLRRLPEQLCSLDKLEEILIRKKGGDFSLPSKIGSLKSLTTLEIVNVKMAVIPTSIGSLEKLQHLSLLRCSGFKELPEMRNLQSLAELQISNTEIMSLPKSIGCLKELKVIKMEHSSITELPCGIMLAEKLEEIRGKNSKNLKGEIPYAIKSLCHLKALDLSETHVGRLPETISQLSHLEELKLPSCCELQNLSTLPGSLTTLGVAFPALSKVHNPFDGLTKLEKLELLIPENTNWDTPFRFPPQLKSLQLSCRDLNCCSELPASLSELILKNADVALASPRFSNLTKLSSLELHHCRLYEDNLDRSAQPKKRKLDELYSLMHFYASGCNFHFTNGLHLPKDLRMLYIKACSFHSEELQLSDFKSLKQLEISECRGLAVVKGLGELASLEELRIQRCLSLERLEGDISLSKRLKALSVDGNNKLEKVEGLHEGFIQQLESYRGGGHEFLPNITPSSTSNICSSSSCIREWEESK